MKKLAIFCGSQRGNDPEIIEMARDFGEQLALAEIGMVYGGAQIGIMGVVADAVLDHGGKVWGVMPSCLAHSEITHHHLTDLLIVDSMHDRKKAMFDISDGFVALPGGIGTLDEFCEVLTWWHIGIHRHPCYVLNFKNFYDDFLQQLKRMGREGFMSQTQLDNILEPKNTEELIEHFLAFRRRG